MLSPISQSANKLTPLMLPLSAIVFSNPIDDFVSELVRRLRIVTECILQQIAEDTRRCIQTPFLYANLIVNYIFLNKCKTKLVGTFISGISNAKAIRNCCSNGTSFVWVQKLSKMGSNKSIPYFFHSLTNSRADAAEIESLHKSMVRPGFPIQFSISSFEFFTSNYGFSYSMFILEHARFRVRIYTKFYGRRFCMS